MSALALCYLSDALSHSLVGGETLLRPHGYSDIITIVPKQGQFIVFDPSIPHKGNMVLLGIKYAIAVTLRAKDRC
jgi:hypothetical protein